MSGSVSAESVVAAQSATTLDAKLIADAQHGDMRAFERLYRLHHRKVFGLCLRMTRQRETAEDCVQKTFIKAWRSLAAFEGRSAFSSWLHRIAVNEVMSHVRRRGFDASEYDTVDEDAGEVVMSLSQVNLGEIADVERALEMLPEGARHVIVLQAIYGHTHEEVAEMLGIAVGTCKAQLHRGRRLLRQLLNLPETMDEH